MPRSYQRCCPAARERVLWRYHRQSADRSAELPLAALPDLGAPLESQSPVTPLGVTAIAAVPVSTAPKTHAKSQPPEEEKPSPAGNPGDIIRTGTPHGVGAFRKPPEFLEGGDVMEVDIEGLGAR